MIVDPDRNGWLMETVEVVGIHADPTSAATVVLLGDPDELTQVLPIFIGPAEAQAIALGLAGVETPRPGTHELMLNLVDQCDAQLERVAVTELVDGTFIAMIELTTTAGARQVSARPSDAIALAIRARIPVLVAEEVLKQAAVPVQHEANEPFDQAEVEAIVGEFRELLDTATVEDFDSDD